MPINLNATMTFVDYEVQDTGIQLHFLCTNPGPGQVTDYYVILTDAEIAAATTNAQLKTLVTDKLIRKLRSTALTTKLDNFIGQSLVV